MKSRSGISWVVALALWAQLQQSLAGEVEPVGKAVATLLGTTKALKKDVDEAKGKKVTVFASKEKPLRYVFLEDGTYQPNCKHLWAVGIEGATGKVIGVRGVSMDCTHAAPAMGSGFLDQYKGKGPADLAKLDSDINIKAKATGSCKLATEAVKRAITTYQSQKGKI